MTVTGIIAEFNLFHNGHKYLLDQAEGVNCCYVRELCSGEVSQLLWISGLELKMALENGADLVVELPFLTSSQSAIIFCCWGRSILSRLG